MVSAAEEGGGRADLACGIDDVEVEVLAFVLDDLCAIVSLPSRWSWARTYLLEHVLDSRVVAIYEMRVDKLDAERGFAWSGEGGQLGVDREGCRGLTD